MRRRQLLAATTSTAFLALSGCQGSVRGPRTYGAPEEEIDARGMEKHLVFTRDSEDQAVVTINQRRKPQSLEQQIPFRFHVWHREGLSIDRLYYKIRSPPHSTGVPADVFLQVPDSGPWPKFELTEDRGWTVIHVDDIGALGDGSLGLDLLIDPVSDPVEELAVRTEVELGGSGVFGNRYRAKANTRFEILSA